MQAEQLLCRCVDLAHDTLWSGLPLVCVLASVVWLLGTARAVTACLVSPVHCFAPATQLFLAPVPCPCSVVSLSSAAAPNILSLGAVERTPPLSNYPALHWQSAPNLPQLLSII